MSQSKKFGFSLIELLVVISIIVLLIGILVPVLARARTTANVMKEGVNERNIHVAATVYGTGNKDWFPGLTSAGKYSTVAFLGKYYGAKGNGDAATSLRAGGPSAFAATTTSSGGTVGATANYAEAVMLEDNGTNPAQWLSPGETNGSIVVATPSTGGSLLTAVPASNDLGLVDKNVNSFALLAYGSSSLKAEWKSTQNNQAVILGSRVIGIAGAATSFNSVWTDVGSAKFRGSVVRGDSSTSSENFDKNDCSTSFSTLRYGSIAGGVNTTAINGIVGPFGDSTATQGTAAGNLGAHVTSGSFDTAMIASENDVVAQ